MASEFSQLINKCSHPSVINAHFFSKEINHEHFFNSGNNDTALFRPPGMISSHSVDSGKPVQMKKEKAGNLPDEIQEKMEKTFGSDFSAVKIHENSTIAEQLNAIAFTQGNEIYFAPGNNPFSSQGEEYLGHELAHAVQQNAGLVDNTYTEAGFNVNDNKTLEDQADLAGIKSKNGQKVELGISLPEKSTRSSIQKKSDLIQKRLWQTITEDQINADIAAMQPEEVLIKYELYPPGNVPRHLFEKYIAPLREKIDREKQDRFKLDRRTIYMNDQGEVGTRENLDFRKALKALTKDLPAMINSGVSGGITYGTLTSLGMSHEKATSAALMVGTLVNAGMTLLGAKTTNPDISHPDQRPIPTLSLGTSKPKPSIENIGKAKTLPEDIGRAKTLQLDISRSKTFPDIRKDKTSPENIGKAKSLSGGPSPEELNKINMELNLKYFTYKIKELGGIVDIKTMSKIMDEADALYPFYLD